jgi:3-polyprenyl-4-hydroxybenzoate decarboxylase
MRKDLRSFLKAAEAARKMHRVTREVDPDRDLAALADESDRVIQFDIVRGYRGYLARWSDAFASERTSKPTR